MISFCRDKDGLDKYKLLRRIGAGSFGSIFVTVPLQKPAVVVLSTASASSAQASPRANALGTSQGVGTSASDTEPAELALPGQVQDGSNSKRAMMTSSSSAAGASFHSSRPNNITTSNANTNNASGDPRSPLLNGSSSGVRSSSAVRPAGAGGSGSPTNVAAAAAAAASSSQSAPRRPGVVYLVAKLEQLPKDVHIAPNAAQTTSAQHIIFSSRSHLVREYKFYRYMHTCVPNLQGIPHVYDFGGEGQFRYLVMDYLGPSLDSLFRSKGKRFTALTQLRLAQQTIARLEVAHTLGIVHRDIKPENFVMGVGDKAHVVYLIDFGLGKMFLRRDTGKHVEIQTGRKLAGTARYCSLWTHEGISQSRRDDLEGLWYTLLYFARGGFPWDQGPADVAVEQYIHNHKKTLSPETLCRNLEEPMRSFLLGYINYVRTLGFTDRPNYDHLRNLCHDALDEIGAQPNITDICDYCWFRRPSPQAAAQFHAGEGSGGGVRGGGSEHNSMSAKEFDAAYNTGRTSSLQGGTARSSMMGGGRNEAEGSHSSAYFSQHRMRGAYGSGSASSSNLSVLNISGRTPGRPAGERLSGMFPNNMDAAEASDPYQQAGYLAE